MARNERGQFTGSDKREPAFDLTEKLRRLFTAAEKAGDFAGASTLARTIASLGAATPETTASENDGLVEQAAHEERLRLREILVALRNWKQAVRERLGKPPLPTSPLDRPAVGQPFFDGRRGLVRLWTLTDEKQVALLTEFLGDRLPEFIAFLDEKEPPREPLA